MEISIQIENRDNWDVVTYVGPINEDSEVHLPNIADKLGKQVIFNFRQVEYVNSCGVRAWINFLRDVEANREVVFEECTPEIVSQINMIPNFKGGAKVKSLYGSYACPDCDHQQWELFEEGRNLPDNPEAELPEVKCANCGAETEMEELEDEFFAWLEAS